MFALPFVADRFIAGAGQWLDAGKATAVSREHPYRSDLTSHRGHGDERVLTMMQPPGTGTIRSLWSS